ncbi:MAG: response regulator transcription factor [Verrucomicrobiales bacterium]|nr:response regulator transcription factor [Verrucomicrobiales bacterium]
MELIRLWVIDDHAGFRRDLVRVLERRGFVCEKVLSSARGLFSGLSAGSLPDAILLDLRMPQISGLEALDEFRRLRPDLTVILLTASDDEADLLAGLRKGAAGYLLKTSTPDEIESAIRRALSGGVTVDPDMNRQLVDKLPAEAEDGAGSLSPKEFEVLRHLADGKPTKRIAADMELSVHTIDSHLRNLYRKLDAPNQSAAVARAFRLGILQ